MNRSLAIGLILSAISLSAQAALHKWVDADGVVHYSDTVPSAEIKSQTLRLKDTSNQQAPAAATGAAPPKTQAEREAEMKKTEQAKTQTAEKAAKDQENAEAKRKNCENARTNLSTLENAPRLVTYDAQGEQTFLGDNTRQQRIEEARKAVSSYCN